MLIPRGKLIIPEKYLPLLGVGAAVAATLTYILWGPDADRRDSKTGTSKRRKVAGLENLGNTCYLNTILQSLAACPVFVKWLSRALRQGFFKGKHNELAYKLSKTLEVVNDHSASHGGSQVYSPHEVLHALYGCSWRADRGQQDAHELFQFLLSVLGEEKEPIPSPVPLCDASRLIEPRRNGLTSVHTDLHSNIEANLPKVANRDGESPFRGLLANHLSCTVCGHRNPVTYSSFDCLTLPIPATVFGALTLESILAKFVQREIVHDVECTECSKRLSGQTTPPPTRTGKKVASPSSRKITPPTPKKAPSASSISFLAPPPSPVAPPSSAIVPRTSPKAAPTSHIVPPTSPSAPPTPSLSTVATDIHPTLAAAPPIFEKAPPASDQNGIDLHIRTWSPKELPCNPSTDSSDQQMQEENDESEYVSSESTEEKKTDAVPSCHDSNGLVMDASSGLVAPTDKLPNRAVKKSTDICNSSTEITGSDETLNFRSSLRQNGGKVLDFTEAEQVNAECFQRNFDVNSTFDSIEEETTQRREHTDCALETQILNGEGKDLAVEAKVLTCLSGGSHTGTKRDTQKLTARSDYLPDGKQLDNENVKQRKIQQSSNSVQGKCSDPDAITPRQNSLSKVAQNKQQPPLKPQLPPLINTASSSAHRTGTSEATPTSSIFGKIPGTDGVALSPCEITDQSCDMDTNEELSPKCRRMFRKQLTLGKLPQCLCIHLQRVTWLTNGLPSRREEHVIFPEYLDMSPFKQTSAMSSAVPSRVKFLRMSSELSDDGTPALDTLQTRRKSSHGFIGDSFLTDPAAVSLVGGGLGQMSPRISHHASGMAEDGSGTKETAHIGETASISDVSWKPMEARYRLASAVIHLGDAFTGHFLTFRRAPPIGNEALGDNWLCISDESVYTSTPTEVFSQKAYMLYYQRM